MFYFLVAPYLVYNGILIAAAVIPAIFLMVKVYRSDKLGEGEPIYDMDSDKSRYIVIAAGTR